MHATLIFQYFNCCILCLYWFNYTKSIFSAEISPKLLTYESIAFLKSLLESPIRIQLNMFETSSLFLPNFTCDTFPPCEWYLASQAKNVFIYFIFTSPLLQISKHYILAQLYFLSYYSKMCTFLISLSNILPNLGDEILYLNQKPTSFSVSLLATS